MVKILDGKIVRDFIASKLALEISRLNLPVRARTQTGEKPKLAIIQVGARGESNVYIH